MKLIVEASRGSRVKGFITVKTKRHSNTDFTERYSIYAATLILL